MSKRIAIGPDQIQQGNKIECHIAGACATYLDTDLQWQISDNTILRHFDSPTDATTGREIWTNRPLTVGVNTHGKRQDLVTIRESSSLGKHTEWTITPLDSYSLRRKAQPRSTEYDLGEQLVQSVNNSTTRIYTPYTGQAEIGYCVTAPAGGEIRNENGQLNAYRDNWYLFTIAEPTIYDADKQLIVDAEGLPVRCYSIRLEIVSAEDGHYIVHKEKCTDVPEDCAWVDVEIFVCKYSFATSRIVYEAWDAAQAAQTSSSSYFVVNNITPGDINNKPRIACGRYNSTQHQIDRSYLNFNSSALVGTVINVDLKLYADVLSGSGIRSAPRIIVQNANIDPVNDNTTTICKTRHRAYATPVYSGPISVVVGDFITVPLLPSCINNNTLATGYTSLALREYDHDYNNSQPSNDTSYGCSFYFSPDESQTAVLSITIDSGHKLLVSSSWRILSRIVKEASWNLLAAITKTSSWSRQATPIEYSSGWSRQATPIEYSSGWSRQATPIEYSSGWNGPNISGDASKSFESLKVNNYTFKVYSNNKFDFKVSKNFNLGD